MDKESVCLPEMAQGVSSLFHHRLIQAPMAVSHIRPVQTSGIWRSPQQDALKKSDDLRACNSIVQCTPRQESAVSHNQYVIRLYCAHYLQALLHPPTEVTPHRRRKKKRETAKRRKWNTRRRCNKKKNWKMAKYMCLPKPVRNWKTSNYGYDSNSTVSKSVVLWNIVKLPRELKCHIPYVMTIDWSVIELSP